jgi:hypothetical protein
MSVIDCQAMGVPVISPRLGWFRERVDPDLLFDDVHEAVTIAERLATDHTFWTRHSIRAQQATQSLSPELVAAEYLATVSS